MGAQKIVLGIRPEHIALGDEGIPAVMGVSEMMGSSIHLHLSAGGQDVVVVVSGMDDTGHFVNNIPEGTGTHILIHENALHLFDGETGRNLEYPKEQFVPGQLPPMEAGEGLLHLLLSFLRRHFPPCKASAISLDYSSDRTYRTVLSAAEAAWQSA